MQNHRQGMSGAVLGVLLLMGAGCTGAHRPPGAAQTARAEEPRTDAAQTHDPQAGTWPRVDPEQEAVRPAGGAPQDAPGAEGEDTLEPGGRLDLERLPSGCQVDRECGALVYVDCGVAADGPAYYVERSSGRILEVCGGACMGPRGETPFCRACPPAEWTCH